MAGSAKKNADGSWTVTNSGGVETRTVEAHVPPELLARAAAGDPLAETERLERELGPKAFPGSKTDEKAGATLAKTEERQPPPVSYPKSAVPPGIQREMAPNGAAAPAPAGDFIVNGGTPGDSLSRGRAAFAHPGATSSKMALERGGSAVPRLDDSRGNLDPGQRSAPPQAWGSDAEREAQGGLRTATPAWQTVEGRKARQEAGLPLDAPTHELVTARARGAGQVYRDPESGELLRLVGPAAPAAPTDGGGGNAGALARAGVSAGFGGALANLGRPEFTAPTLTPEDHAAASASLAGVAEKVTPVKPVAGAAPLERAVRPGAAAEPDAPAGGPQRGGGPPPVPGHGATVREIRDYQTWLEINKPRGSSPIVHHPDADQDTAYARHWEGAPSKETKDAELHANLRAATFGAEQTRALDDMDATRAQHALGVPAQSALPRYIDQGTQGVRMERLEAKQQALHDQVFGAPAEQPVYEQREVPVLVTDADGNPVRDADGVQLTRMEMQQELVKEGKSAVPPAMVDPDKFWGDKSLGQKVLAVVGLALGGMGSAAAHQENVAFKIFQDGVRNNIAAQERNITEKKQQLGMMGELVKAEIDAGHGREAGRARAEMAAIQQFDLRLKAAALESGSPLAQRKYEIAHAHAEAAYAKAAGDYEAIVNGKRDRSGKVIAAHTTGGMSAGPNWDKIAGWQKDAQASEGHDATTQLTRANAQKATVEAQGGGKDAPMVVPWGGRELVFRKGITSEAQTKTTEAMAAAEGVRANIERLSEQQVKMGANTIDKKTAEAMVTTVASQVNGALGQGAMSMDEKNGWVGSLTGMRSSEARAFMTDGLDNIVMGRVGVYMQGAIDPKTGKVVKFR